MAELFAKLKQAEMLTEDKYASLEKAKQMKEEGNEYFKEKEFKKAIRKYHEALMNLNTCRQMFSSSNPEKGRDYSGYPPDTVDFYKQCDQLRNVVKLNIAACMIAQEDCKPDYYLNAVKHCNEVLQEDPNNPKAWYRKGVGLFLAKNYHTALDVLKRVDKSLKGKDEKIRGYISICQSQVNEGERQLKERMSKAFGDVSNGGSSVSVKSKQASACESPASMSHMSTDSM